MNPLLNCAGKRMRPARPQISVLERFAIWRDLPFQHGNRLPTPAERRAHQKLMVLSHYLFNKQIHRLRRTEPMGTQ